MVGMDDALRFTKRDFTTKLEVSYKAYEDKNKNGTVDSDEYLSSSDLIKKDISGDGGVSKNELNTVLFTNGVDSFNADQLGINGIGLHVGSLPLKVVTFDDDTFSPVTQGSGIPPIPEQFRQYLLPS